MKTTDRKFILCQLLRHPASEHPPSLSSPSLADKVHYLTCGSSQDGVAPFLASLLSYNSKPVDIIQQTNTERLNGRKKKESWLGISGLEEEQKDQFSGFLLASYISWMVAGGALNFHRLQGRVRRAKVGPSSTLQG